MTWLDDLLVARNVNAYDAQASVLPLQQLSDWWTDHIPYCGPNFPIVSRLACVARKYGACGDAAASLLGACMRQRIRGARLCIERPSTGPADYLHVRVVVAGVGSFDPYAAYRPPGLPPTCEAWAL